MKKLLLSLSLCVLTSQAFASVKIEEELFVLGQKPEVLKELITAGSVEIDHVTSKGFEIYGRNGLSQYLDEKKIPYFDMKSVSKLAFAEYPSHAQIRLGITKGQTPMPQLQKILR